MKVSSCLYCGDKRLSFVTRRADKTAVLKCENCGLMMVESISDNVSELYSGDYFQKKEDNSVGYTDYLSSPTADLIGKYAFAKLFVNEPVKHLDLGCADGSLIEIFQQAGFESSGLEISKEAAQIAKSKGVDVSVSNLERFPKSKINLGLITAFDVLEHLDKLKPTLNEIQRSLSPDGYFVFSTLSVRDNTPTDYWFNNSLEHYIYFNEQNLSRILSETFGEDSFAFVEIDNGGAAEFWGIAKKGQLSDESNIFELLSKRAFNRDKADQGYLLSLFYNQVSKFVASKKIIDYFHNRWNIKDALIARFYNEYFQGRYELAINIVNESKTAMSADNPIFWQALNHAQHELYGIKYVDLQNSHEQEINSLSSDVYRYREKIQSLEHSKIVGNAIKLREGIGSFRGRIRSLPKLVKGTVKKIVVPIRNITAPLIPGTLRRKIKDSIRAKHSYRLVTVNNQKWKKDAPILSVVVPYFNREKTIDDTVNSLLSQTFQNFEIIIVDDGSTQKESVEKLDTLEKKDLPIRIIRQDNQGVSNARNNGISEARGKYIICLDSDDILDDTYIEKVLLLLETQPDVAIASTYMEVFGVADNIIYKHGLYNPVDLIKNNTLTTAAAFKKEAWEVSGGYKPDVGYEDWEFWLTLGEHGYWGRIIPEPLFKYRTALVSKFIQDKYKHKDNISAIKLLHPNYKKKISNLQKSRNGTKNSIDPKSAFINFQKAESYLPINNRKPNVLIALSWMTFGGAETLVHNYCSEINDLFNLSFVTGLKSENEWEYKFKQITPRIYHLANLFDDRALYAKFVSNYIKTRNIDILHIIHNDYLFELLPFIKKQNPKLKIITTIFNNRAVHYQKSVKAQKYIDVFSTDNSIVADLFKRELAGDTKIAIIPNGVDPHDTFKPNVDERRKERKKLKLKDDDVAVFFIGRLSEEKNPNVFLKAASVMSKKLKANQNVSFYVIGDGPQRRLVEKIINKLGLNNVRYLGYKQDVSKYLNAGDIFVLPSSVEGFPLSILEAMAMEVVPIASKVGAVPDIITSGTDGFIVSAGSVKEIVDNISMLVSNPKKLQSAKKATRKKVINNYSNEILGSKYEELYRGTLE